jgi:hypothetical protein
MAADKLAALSKVQLAKTQAAATASAGRSRLGTLPAIRWLKAAQETRNPARDDIDTPRGVFCRFERGGL